MTSIFEGDVSRTLSVELFQEVKPTCVKLSELATKPTAVSGTDADELKITIKRLNHILADHRHRKSPNGELYYLTPNLADYVFFPLSNLLKQDTLDEIVCQNILDIISFLIVNSWVPNHQFSESLIDQLLPVVLFLMKGRETDMNTVIEGKNIEAKSTYNRVLWSIVRHLDKQYFSTGDYKRLSMLGDVSSLVLAILKSLSGTKSQEHHLLVKNVLQTVKVLLVNSITSNQLARIFPGSISTVINSCIESKDTLDYHLLAQTVDLLRELIVKVFNDDVLKIEVESQTVELADLNDRWNKNKDLEVTEPVSVNVSVHNGEDLSDAWLRATSGKLKLSLNSFFKAVVYENKNRARISKPSVVEAITRFNQDILQYCFWSLFNQIVPICVDVLAFVCHSVCFPEHGRLDFAARQEVLQSHVDDIYYPIVDHDVKAFEKVLVLKLEDLIDVKLASILKSSSEERITQFLVSLEFHFVLLKRISKKTVSRIIQRLLLSLRAALADTTLLAGKKPTPSKKEFLDSYTETEEVFEQQNKLDDIQLPPYVNVESITKFDKGQKPQSKAEITNDLLYLSRTWATAEVLQGSEQTRYFEETLPKDVEVQIEELVKFLGQLQQQIEDEAGVLATLELVLLDLPRQTERVAGLWIANHFFIKTTKEKFNVDDFLDFGDDDATEDPPDEEPSETVYLLASQVQNTIEEVVPQLSNLTIVTGSPEQMLQHKLNEKSFAMALDSISVLASQMSKDELKEVVLIEYLLPIFEGLTFSSNSLVQSHSRNAIMSIANSHYDGSLTRLISDNSDYLIDALSFKLSVPGSLTPSVPGILLIILKISGLELLFNNQLSDLISQIFTLIDSYHGYSVLVAGFFVLFDELIRQLRAKYDSTKQIDSPPSLYKPWGMTSLEQAKVLVDESKKLVDAFQGYDRNKEYFRHKDAPFSELEAEDVDSDDEVDDGQEKKEDEEKWVCDIPREVYMIVQQVFIYGMRLLSHPSDTLKVQLLKTMTEVYPLLSTNYPLVLPLVADNWAEVLGLFSSTAVTSDEVAVQALTFLTVVVETDRQHNDTFFGKRFIDSCNMVLSRFEASRQSSELVKVSAFKTQSSARLSESLASYLVAGVNNYQRIVPDITALRIMKLVARLSARTDNYGQQARNISWVLAQE